MPLPPFVTSNVTVTAAPAQTGLDDTVTVWIVCAEDCKLKTARNKHPVTKATIFLLKKDLPEATMPSVENNKATVLKRFVAE